MSTFDDLDCTPQPSDWTDVYDMLADIKAFLREHPAHDLIPADDPGVPVDDPKAFSPPRVPRLGFSAFRTVTPEFAAENVRRMARGEDPVEWDEQSKIWTIPLPLLKASMSLGKMDSSLPALAESLKTAKGRTILCLALKIGYQEGETTERS